jgi:flagellar basal body-associated protein FliL
MVSQTGIVLIILAVLFVVGMVVAIVVLVMWNKKSKELEKRGILDKDAEKRYSKKQ